eukprot:TRINITY_DN9865_c0_g2_i2.p1 TRINITY_DN9865_c0_g2~~TRINITY_DN9865_c0_g2_i2.p1  ORF type:complete len:200 (+),score=48.96 TRINITY_DN9865_c0_g2_i2:70-600(+)
MPEGHIRLKPSTLNQQSTEKQEVVITARDAPVVWKAFTNDPDHLTMRPGAGVIPARGKASVFATLKPSTAKMASQIVAKPLSEMELSNFSALASPDKPAAAKKLYTEVSESLKTKHTLTIASPEASAPSSSSLMRILPTVLAFVFTAVVFFILGLFAGPFIYKTSDGSTPDAFGFA